MTEHYTNKSAAELLLEADGVHADPSDKRIEVGDYIEIEVWEGWYADGIVDHVPCKISDCWIIIEEDGLPRYCYDPPSLKLVRKGERQQ